MHKTCNHCGAPLAGRVDKKYCSDYCRTMFHNRINRSGTNLMRKIQRTLRKNRQILERLNPAGRRRIHRAELEREGFNFHFHTHHYVTNAGSIYVFCFEQGYQIKDNDYYILVEKKSFPF